MKTKSSTEKCQNCKSEIRKGPTVKTVDGKPFTHHRCDCTDELNAQWNEKLYTEVKTMKFQYATADTSTLAGLKKAEQLKELGWKIIHTGLFLIQFERKVA
jgi:hypothetical protein